MMSFCVYFRNVCIDRKLDSIEYSSFDGIENEQFLEFKEDIESGNDSIELHLIKSKSYKEALALNLKTTDGSNSDAWRNFLREEQKTFGGSKIFYMNNDCSKLLILSVPNEMRNKLGMVITRLNKINSKITRINSKIKKENVDLYTSRVKNKMSTNRHKEDIINLINEYLRV